MSQKQFVKYLGSYVSKKKSRLLAANEGPPFRNAISPLISSLL